MTVPHWLLGDRLGPHFLTAGPEGPARDAPVVMIEARSVFRRRRFHRAKAHLVLSAMRHRAAELGDRVRYVRRRDLPAGAARGRRGRPGHGAPPDLVRGPAAGAVPRRRHGAAGARLLVARDDSRAWADWARW